MSIAQGKPIHHSIGTRFEDMFLEDFPDFERSKVSRNGISIPDFHNLDFFVEAKAGYHEWGPKSQKRQIEGFPKLRGLFPGVPILYALGFHNFNDAERRVMQKNEEERQD